MSISFPLLYFLNADCVLKPSLCQMERHIQISQEVNIGRC